MGSPFAPFTNATLTFQLPTGKVSFNGVGNRVVETAPTIIKAMLRPVRDVAEINFYVGDDETAELMTGYITEPLPPPAGLNPPIEGKAKIKTAVGRVETGTFKLLPSSSSPYLIGLGIISLSKLYGVFRHG